MQPSSAGSISRRARYNPLCVLTFAVFSATSPQHTTLHLRSPTATVAKESREGRWTRQVENIEKCIYGVILWNPKVHHRIHKSTTPFPILSQINSVYAPHPTSQRSILILSSHLRLCLPGGLLPSGFLTKALYTPLTHTCHMSCPSLSS